MNERARPASRLPQPPGTMGMPLLGETISFGKNPKHFVRTRVERHGPVFATHLLGSPTVFMVGPEAARFVLMTHRDHFRAREGWPPGLRELMGGSLMMRDGDEHRFARRLLAPAFFGAALDDYVPTMEATTQRYLARWRALGTLSWYEEFKRLSFDIASQLILGAQPGADLDTLSGLFTAYTKGMEGIHPILRIRLRFTPFGKAIAARDELLAHVARIAETRRHAATTDALSRMVRAQTEQGVGLSDEDVAKHALFLLFAGHESTASLMTSFALEMARHPEKLARAREEQRPFQGTSIGISELDAMPYLNQVFLELERRHPPFSGAFRHVVKAFEINGFHVPAGWKVFYAIGGTHHDPEIYDEPERFSPCRFAEVRVTEERRSCRLLGFGAGPRTCLGMDFARLEARLVACHLLRDYQWTLVPGQRLDSVYIPSLYPKDGLRVAFGRRDGAPGHERRDDATAQ